MPSTPGPITDVLYRVFPLVADAGPTEYGGPLHVPRSAQGRGRHDVPRLYGAFYASRQPEGPVAERLKDLRLRKVGQRHLERGLARLALASFFESLPALLDLDDPANLVARELRPSRVATSHRPSTQTLARRLYEEGLAGFEWWSTIEASWINVTLFAERALDAIKLAEEPELLTTDHPVVQAAARAVGVRLES